MPFTSRNSLAFISSSSRFLNPNWTWKRDSRPGRRVGGGKVTLSPRASSPMASLLRNRLECQDFFRGPRPGAAPPPSQHQLTVAERRPATPGLSHLLFQGFLRDSIRKLRHHLLLSLFPSPARDGLSRPLTTHLLASCKTHVTLI